MQNGIEQQMKDRIRQARLNLKIAHPVDVFYLWAYTMMLDDPYYVGDR